ncbi:MaoC family dehydratase N-terminal domain-containing protein [Allorhizocola rhizosphaerae]|uniref:MaoC family dehydratase N-terminal domain-containing protein n=1 Tax=Allorhizocola rhizosphaerae TaxID=1872709 RepID=UPI000E3B5B61|nr:MaoC family dehydratase N-terminal domain-containing protein [Allorhizocola rhizosphaerae]
MPLDQSFVGRSYPPTAPYQVGREKVREFATAIGATDPLHFDPEAAKAAGYPDVVAPPTFPIVLTMAALKVIVLDPDLGVDYSRVVHGDQRFSYNRPVVAGDELVVVNHIEEIMTRAGNDFLTTRQEVRTTADELVATVWHKTVVRGESA